MRIGILLNNVEYNQFVHYASEFLLRNDDKVDMIGFFENPFASNQRFNFPLMQITELYSFDGIAIATNITTAQTLLSSPSPKEKYLYLWDLEWLRQPMKIYHNFAKIYRNKELKIIVRSKDHAKLIEDCFNIKVKYIADNFKLEKILCLKQKRIQSTPNQEENN